MLYHFAGSDSISLILVTTTEFYRKCSNFNNCEYINTDKWRGMKFDNDSLIVIIKIHSSTL